MSIAIAILLATIFCQSAYYNKWLDASGALAAICMGTIILMDGQWLLALPMLFFFITGSLFSRLRKKSIVSDSKSKKPRDHIQVLSNGGIAICCLLLYKGWHRDFFLTAYYLSIAVSTADTWSSEIGTWSNGRVIDIVSFKKMARGISGGISVAGTLAGCIGAFAIAVTYHWFLNANASLFGVILVGGITGMLLDSIIGSKMQARYCKNDGTYIEYAENDTRLEKGLKWMTNDLVNLLSNLVITAIGLVQLSF